ncbi:putative oxidoreductase YdgJ [Maioricimonas rarisocia]|uniref:Putative oxidoreductase YdgJ n=1 Tax=Maioricimonas rarisocia TaxID=2528026 RepID=A0A517ZA50_9PLAN|nr:Gfo/Idh/MocA family oxidoreductase [Maioricimonas rarisocia]QDU39321.1 putative oxidoreductase YdgJ [Maioricimonas rarisocia]
MTATPTHRLRAGMIGMGMIFDETYRPFFERAHQEGVYSRRFGDVDVPLTGVATRTGRRAEAYHQRAVSAGQIADFRSFAGENSVGDMLEQGVDFACVATPDDRHFPAAKAVLESGTHLLVEKPSVLKLQELDELIRLADEKGVLAKAVYHKLLDPDHKKLRTLVHDDVLQHVNTGYCTLLEPKAISGSQFSEWITGRNPGTYVAVHYIKLIDFSFGGRLKTVMATGQRGLVGPADGPTWDSNQLRMIYEYEDGREAAFDIHTSWVTPDNFPGYVEQEVQFRFDNGVWNGHSRKRGVECTVEGKTPNEMKISINNHYNAPAVEPWGERTQRGYGVEVIERFVREVADVEYGGPESERAERLHAARSLTYNDLSADRQVVAAVQALEAILERAANGEPDCVVRVNDPRGGLVLYRPGSSDAEVLYEPTV